MKGPREPFAAFLRRVADRLDPAGAPASQYETRAALADLWSATKTVAVTPTCPQERSCRARVENLREAWLSLQAIRETVETLGPIGCLRSNEHVAYAVAPTFTAEAEELIRGIRAIAADKIRVRLRAGSRTVQPTVASSV